MYLVDTNVISEVMKPHPNAKVAEWLMRFQDELYLSSITIEEMRFGEMMMPAGKRRNKLSSMIDKIVDSYSSRTLPFDAKCAKPCAQLHALAISCGRTPTIEDLMIASIALTNNCTLATRNMRDFDYMDMEVLNPFS